MKYYENDEKSGVLYPEHVCCFLENYPYLLTFMVTVSNMICDRKSGIDENWFIKNNCKQLIH